MARRRRKIRIFRLISKAVKAQRRHNVAKKRAETKRVRFNNQAQKALLREYAKEQKLAKQTQDAWSPVQPLESTPGRNTPGSQQSGSQTGLKPGQCGYPTKDGTPCRNTGKCPYHANKRRPKANANSGS